MRATCVADVAFYDFHPQAADFHAEALAGLQHQPKSLPPKFFYDKRGSELFDRICELDEYYPTRTETAILEHHAGEIAGLVGEDCVLIEYGSGSSRKIRLLIDELGGRLTYIAIDISRQHLLESARELAESYPELEVIAVCADYSKPFELPSPKRRSSGKQVVFFPGSTIGNFSPPEARRFLQTTAGQVGPGGSLLIGVDLKKDVALLHAAYNDSEGVTAAFNKNLLRRMNVELGADFDLEAFRHEAFYNAAAGRIEMHLVSLNGQQVRLNGASIHFRCGETIHTENSYKFHVEEFQDLAAGAGFRLVRVWTDAQRLFSVHYLTAGQLDFFRVRT
jgi:dimethylhistidine N-methyltransferase